MSSSLLLSLPEDCQLLVFSFLSLRDISRCQALCRQSHRLLCTHNEFWTEIFARICCNYHLNNNNNNNGNNSLAEVPFSLYSAQNARLLLSQLFSATQRRQFAQLNHDVVEVSSMDRSVENPRNTLRRSPCMEQIAPLRRQHRDAPEHMIHRVGYLFQRHRCQCIGSERSCYWSSAPHAAPDLIEFVTFQSAHSVSIVQGFTLSVYQAFFQPNAPIYAPVEACLQILSPSHPLDFLPFPRAGHAGADDHQSYRNTSAQLNKHILYQSPFFEVAHTADTQYFCLPAPLLCVGGRVRVVLRGARERQNLADWGIAAHADDFYVCLSSVEIFGVPLKGYDARLTAQGWEIFQETTNSRANIVVETDNEFIEFPPTIEAPSKWISAKS